MSGRISRRDERGAALVEMPLAVCIVLLLGMGVVTIVQLTWTHLALSSGVRTATRYATHVDYDPLAGGADRHRTADQIRAWVLETAAEAGVDPDDPDAVTIVGRRVPSGEPVTADEIDQLVAGDEITITLKSVVSNPLYRLGASVANAASHVFGGGDVFDPEGVGVSAGAVSYVE